MLAGCGFEFVNFCRKTVSNPGSFFSAAGALDSDDEVTPAVAESESWRTSNCHVQYLSTVEISET